eukprot:COSAG06_NODE_67144_length_252_cov_1.444444_1_plen_69_part_01
MAQKSRFLQEFSYLTGAIRSMIEALDSPEPTAAQVTKQNGGGGGGGPLFRLAGGGNFSKRAAGKKKEKT